MSIPTQPMRAADAQAQRAGGATVPQNVLSAVRQASDRTGVDFSYLMAKAAQESSFDPAAKASTSSATGLYQFIERTWLDMVEQHGAKYGAGGAAARIQRRGDGTPFVSDPETRQQILDMRKDPKLSAFLAAEYTRSNQAHLQQAVGGDIGAAELYMAHFLGAGGASKFLNALRDNPGQSAASLMPEAAAANRAVFYDKSGKPLSVAQIYDRFAAKFDGAPPAGMIADADDTAEWTGGAGLRSRFARAGAGSGTPLSLFTVMVLSQLGTPADDGNKGTNRESRLPAPAAPSLGAV